MRHGNWWNFNPRPLAGATKSTICQVEYHEFQSTPPCGGDSTCISCRKLFKISIHAPLRGRPDWTGRISGAQNFNPRPLAGATNLHMDNKQERFISIHAPLRGRLSCFWWSRALAIFQSTPPCGGDASPSPGIRKWRYFNPRPLAGATFPPRHPGHRPTISIHAPLRGRPSVTGPMVPTAIFQSTPPCGGDRRCPDHGQPERGISIHAPLRGRPGSCISGAGMAYFNPRPLAGATQAAEGRQQRPEISIHAPLRGRPSLLGILIHSVGFQSTPPCGGDRKDGLLWPSCWDFNPRPLAGATIIFP